MSNPLHNAHPTTNNFVRVGDKLHPITNSFVVRPRYGTPAILEFYNTVPGWHPFSSTTWWWDLVGPRPYSGNPTPEPGEQWLDYAFVGNPASILVARARFLEQAMSFSLLGFELRRTDTPPLDIPIDNSLFLLPPAEWGFCHWQQHRQMPMTETTPRPLWSELWGADLPTPPIGTRGWSWGGANRTDVPGWGGTAVPEEGEYVFWVRATGEFSTNFDAFVDAILHGPTWLAGGAIFSDELFLPGQTGIRLLSTRYEHQPWERYPHLL